MMNSDNPRKRHTYSHVNLWFLWVTGNTAGWIIGIGGALLAGMLFTDSLTRENPSPDTYNYSGLVGVAAAFLLALVLCAFLVGLTQWLILRREITKSGVWLVVTFLGTLIGLIMAVTIGKTIPGWIAFGAVAGILQWWVLKSQVNRAGNWILINTLAGATGGFVGWIFTSHFESRMVVSTMGVMFSAILVPPVVASLITGFGLVWILRQGPPVLDVVTPIERTESQPSFVMDDSEQAMDWLEKLADGTDRGASARGHRGRTNR
jgi:hypothetical protein